MANLQFKSGNSKNGEIHNVIITDLKKITT